MSYVDLIIKYLSGDLSQEEATSFEEEMESNDELRSMFEEYAAAYNLIRDQLRERDEKFFRRKLDKKGAADQIPNRVYPEVKVLL